MLTLNLESVMEQRSAWSRTKFEEYAYKFMLSDGELLSDCDEFDPRLCSKRSSLNERYVDGGDLNKLI